VEIKENLKRTILDVFLLISIGVVLFVLPVQIERQGAELFLFKVLLVSAGTVHAHILRKLFFPYINFRETKNKYHAIMVIALYLVVIWAYSRGG
jgi:cbb3-type cytochrome oxidase subunit 3